MWAIEDIPASAEAMSGFRGAPPRDGGAPFDDSGAQAHRHRPNLSGNGQVHSRSGTTPTLPSLADALGSTASPVVTSGVCVCVSECSQ